MDFTSLDELKDYLVYDQKRASLSPVRFINVETMAVWVEAKKLVLSLSDRSLFLSSYCEGGDTTPNIRRVTSALKNYDKTTCVAPLSEYLRINPAIAQSTILKILSNDYKNNDDGTMRIYFLMYRMKDILRNIPNEDPRRKDAILYLNTSEESDYSLTIIQDDLKVSLQGNEIFGFKKYLQYWEQNPNKPLILHTKNAIYFEENNFFDNVLVIATSYDLLRYRYNFPLKISVSLGSKDNWKELTQLVAKEGTFELACRASFSTNRLNEDLFEKWNKYNSFQKWLLWIWLKRSNGNAYAILCANATNSPEEFQNELFVGITKYVTSSNYEKVYFERKKLLKSIGELAIPTAFWSILDNLHKIDALRCLTDLSVIEKKAILDLIKHIGYARREECYSVLYTVYPELAKYFESNLNPNPANLTEDHVDYFSKYKWLKVTNNLTEDFINIVKKFALTKGESVYQLYARSYIVSELYDDETAVLFVDGMGAEYIDYLSSLFSELPQSEYEITYSIGYCHLPTITEVNKDFLMGKQQLPPIYTLDELKHSNVIYPMNIIKEFEELKRIKDIVINSFNGSIKKIIITSDHGTSRMAVLVRETPYDTKVKPEGREIYRYGRYCNGTDLENELPTAINHDGKLIFADYTRFEQKGAPANEIHGGASLEEWLVPVISIAKCSKSNVAENVVVETTTPIVKPELGTGKVTIKFLIKGKKCSKVFAAVTGRKIACAEADGIYQFEYIPNSKDTEIKVRISDGEKLGEFIVQIKQKITRNKNFDI